MSQAVLIREVLLLAGCRVKISYSWIQQQHTVSANERELAKYGICPPVLDVTNSVQTRTCDCGDESANREQRWPWNQTKVKRPATNYPNRMNNIMTGGSNTDADVAGGVASAGVLALSSPVHEVIGPWVRWNSPRAFVPWLSFLPL